MRPVVKGGQQRGEGKSAVEEGQRASRRGVACRLHALPQVRPAVKKTPGEAGEISSERRPADSQGRPQG